MKVQSCYRALGASWEGAMQRFGCAETVEGFLRQFRTDENLVLLHRACSAGDHSTAYRAAHTLKGAAAMLGLTQLALLAGKLADELRAGRIPPEGELRSLDDCWSRTMGYISALDVPPARLTAEALESMQRCFSGMQEEIAVLEADTGRCLFGPCIPDVPEELVWDAAWLKQSSSRGGVSVWHYAPGYAVIRREGRADMLSMMGHDIRTPLHIIAGMSREARACRADTARLRACLDRIDVAGEHLRALVGGMVRETERREAFSLPDMLKRAVMLVQPQSLARSQCLRVSTEAVRHPLVRADRNRLARIVLNLLSNAIKYTPPGGEVVLSCREEHAIYTLTVQDSGAGMSESFVQRAFTPYARAALDAEGQGLGLPIVRRLAEQLGGRATLRSERGLGTAVEVRLPLEAEMGEDALAGLHILVVDDHPLCAGTTAGMLSRLGASVSVLTSGQEALRSRVQADCVVMDLHLPDMDGFTVGRMLRCRSMAVLALSGEDSKDARCRAKAAGMQELLTKPVSPAQLACAIVRAVEANKKETARQRLPVDSVLTF